MDLILPPAPPTGNIGVELVKAGARVEQDGETRWLFRELDLSLKPGECTGVIGRNGAGKTTLLRLCLGEREPDEGTVTIGKKVTFNYIDQGRIQLDGSKTVIEEVADLGGETVSFGGQKLAVRSYLRRFLFSDDRVRERVDRLSGGERARLLLAKVLKRGGNLIVLDEPTNDLDLPSLRMLEEALAHFDGSVLVVSHDRYFLDRVCDQIVAFEDDGVFVQPGNYSYYLEKRRERESRPSGVRPQTQAPASSAPKGRVKKLSFKETRELEGMEELISKTEARTVEIETLLNDPAFYVTRSQEAASLQEEMEALKSDIIRLYARWEELDAIRANA
jgi:ATP-binding cassette subfamily F protein uup